MLCMFGTIEIYSTLSFTFMLKDQSKRLNLFYIILCPMIKFFFSFIAIVFLAGCKQSVIEQNFSSSDSLVIHFKDEQAGIVTKTVETSETSAIKKITGFIDASATENFKCGYDGKMFFYSKGLQVQEVDFQMKDAACRHFSFLLDGKLMSTKMSNEAVSFFESLEKRP